MLKLSNGNDYTFKNKVTKTSDGFSHTSTLFENGVSISTKTIKYYNRTWEAYDFQKSMTQAVELAPLTFSEKDELIKALEGLA